MLIFPGPPTWLESGLATVEVWTIPLKRPGLPDDTAFLSLDEQVRAARFRFDDDRMRWIRAHSALRQILGNQLNVSPAALTFTAGAHGKPSLAGGLGTEFNLSHSGDYAMVAVSDRAVGIDIEQIRVQVDMAVLLRRLSETDLPDDIPGLYRRWTQREARSKAAGGELFAAPRSDIFALDIVAPEGYSASIASVGSLPSVRYH